MISCGREGRPDLYGLGIRLGIYFQWFGEILVEFFDQADVSDIRLLGFLLSGAVVLALLVQVADRRVQGADIYIMLQLAAGSYIFLVPMYIWKALTCCDRRWDPLRQTREAQMAVFNVSTMVLLVIISALHLWFFSTYMPTKGRQCGYYGFFFAKVRLDNTAYVAVNIIVYVIVILVCFSIALSWTGFWNGQCGPQRHRRRRRHRRRESVSLPLILHMHAHTHTYIYRTQLQLTHRQKTRAKTRAG